MLLNVSTSNTFYSRDEVKMLNKCNLHIVIIEGNRHDLQVTPFVTESLHMFNM